MRRRNCELSPHNRLIDPRQKSPCFSAPIKRILESHRPVLDPNAHRILLYKRRVGFRLKIVLVAALRFKSNHREISAPCALADEV